MDFATVPGEDILVPLNPKVRWYHRLIFCYALGWLSFMFAEMFVGNVIPFISVFQMLVTVQLYLFHIVVIAKSLLHFSGGRITLTALWLGGGVFGLYEAYITKVIWDPTWFEDFTYKVGGVAIMQTLILILLWHNWFAFIFPLVTAETLFANSEHTEILFAFPPLFLKTVKTKKRQTATLAIIASILAGIYSCAGVPNFAFSFLSLSVILFVSLLVFILRRMLRDLGEISLRDLLPQRVGTSISVFGLIGIYVFGGVVLRPDKIPGILDGQLLVWCLYFLFIFLLVWSLYYGRHRDMDVDYHLVTIDFSGTDESESNYAIPFRWVNMIILAICFVVASALSALAFKIPLMVEALLLLPLGTLLGVGMLVQGMIQAAKGIAIFINKRKQSDDLFMM